MARTWTREWKDRRKDGNDDWELWRSEMARVPVVVQKVTKLGGALPKVIGTCVPLRVWKELYALWKGWVRVRLDSLTHNDSMAQYVLYHRVENGLERFPVEWREVHRNPVRGMMGLLFATKSKALTDAKLEVLKEEWLDGAASAYLRGDREAIEALPKKARDLYRLLRAEDRRIVERRHAYWRGRQESSGRRRREERAEATAEKREWKRGRKQGRKLGVKAAPKRARHHSPRTMLRWMLEGEWLGRPEGDVLNQIAEEYPDSDLDVPDVERVANMIRAARG